MPLGTEWTIRFKTSQPLGETFVEGVIIECIGMDEDGTPMVKDIHVTCLKELTDAEYTKHDAEQEAWRKEHGITSASG
jgi:hypothetical protein